MQGTYVALDDAAILEDITYKGFTSRLTRNPNQFNTKTEPNPNGGRDKVLVSVNSLSQQAKRKYKAQVNNSKVEHQDVPWYIYADYNWYKEKHQNYFYEAVALAKYIQKYLDGDYEMTPGEFEEFLSEKYKVSTRTIRRRIADYVEANAWAIQKELETGENYGYLRILAVGRKPKENGNFPSLTEEMEAYIENMYYDEEFRQNNNSVMNLYEDLQDLAEDKQWKRVPSYDTVLRYIKFLESEDGKGVADLAAKGLRYWKNKWMMKRSRDTGALQVLEMVQGDVHTLDCWVRVQRANGKWQAIRPCLVAWIDTKSRALVGWVICENPDAQIMKQSLLHVIYPKKNEKLPFGVPKYLLIDNGKEYTAETLTGRPRTERVCFDEDAQGFYRSMGIQDDIRSLPYQPWSKAQIERFFGTVCNKFTKRMKSYTGTLTGGKTSAKVEKNIRHMLENEELMTLDEFAPHFEKWVVEKYHPRRHRGLIAQGEETPAPIETFNKADKYFKAAPPIDYAVSLLMKGETRVVSNMGIQRTVEGKAIFYTHTDLAKYQGEKVQFKYFPEDITKVLIYTMDGKRICEALSYELLHIAPKVSEAALEEHVKDQKRQLRGTKDKLSRRRMTHEERQELQLENAGKKIAAPELSNETQKITSLVVDNRYTEDKKAKKQATRSTIKGNAQNVTNEYLKRKSDEAAALLAKLG